MTYPESDFWARNFPTFKRTQRWSRWLNDPTFRVLRRIEADRMRRTVVASGSVIDQNWLLSHRAQLRRLIPYGHIGTIKSYMRQCPPEMVPLCVWLIGKCADRPRFYGLDGYMDDPSPQIRRHVAKAFRRLEAWHLLERMARLNPDDARIQWFATAPPVRRSFPDRLKSYKHLVDDSHADEVATPSRMPYWAKEKSWEYTPPKSRDLIRRMLRRIRHWVRWGVT
jgi:hypothetical protein